MNIEFSPQHEAEADDSGKIHFSDNDKCNLKTVELPGSFYEFCQQQVSRADILDFRDQAFLLRNVLSHGECQHFISQGEKLQFESIQGGKDNYRGMKRIMFESTKLADILWQRIFPWLSDISIPEDPHTIHIHGIGFFMNGTWSPVRLNSVFRLCRYLPGGHFAPHFDGYYVHNSQERSLQTFMLYLNGDFDGGSTNFIDEMQTLHMDEEGKYCAEEKNILCRIQPETGLAIIFNHHRLHEGQKLWSGMKYILRTDIMYRNTSHGTKTEREEEALQLLQEAERKEAAGECMKAAELYRKAFKLSPAVEASYGN